MRIDRLWLADFRNYDAAELTLPPGLTVVIGDNGSGKTNLLEAVAYVATLDSFRAVGNDALVRAGATTAVVRGEGERNGRALLVEAEIHASGRGRVTLNRQPLRRSADLSEAFRATVFSPDDLELVKGGPTGRRRYLDDTLANLHPRHAATRRDFERVLRQRNALLTQMAATRGRTRIGQGGLDADAETTLDVWNARLVQTGEAVADARVDLVGKLEPAVAKAYAQLAGDTGDAGGRVVLAYDAPWRASGLAAAVAAARRDELRRGVTLVGPHRDDLVLTLNDKPARTQASQGEQRTLALALRLAAHQVVTDLLGEPPILLLDDVFSELDATRARALLANVPPGQTVLTSTGLVPDAAHPDKVVHVAAGVIA